MRAFIAGLAFFVLGASAEPTSICLSKIQSAALLDQDLQTFRVLPLDTGDLKIERIQQTSHFWIYRATNQVLPSLQAQGLCRDRSQEYQKARFGTVIETLRQSNPLAIVFFLSLASAGNADLVCRKLETSRLFRLVASGVEGPAFGDDIYLNDTNSQLLDAQRGLVFSRDACPASTSNR